MKAQPMDVEIEETDKTNCFKILFSESDKFYVELAMNLMKVYGQWCSSVKVELNNTFKASRILGKPPEITSVLSMLITFRPDDRMVAKARIKGIRKEINYLLKDGHGEAQERTKTNTVETEEERQDRLDRLGIPRALQFFYE